MQKDVLLHSCFSQAHGDQLPKRCRCRKRLTDEEARHAVATGEIAYLVVGHKEGRPLISTAQCVGALKLLRVPRAKVCDAIHIEYAAGMASPEWAEEERARLEVLAELNLEFFRSLMTSWKPEYDALADQPAIRRLGD